MNKRTKKRKITNKRTMKKRKIKKKCKRRGTGISGTEVAETAIDLLPKPPIAYVVEGATGVWDLMLDAYKKKHPVKSYEERKWNT